MEKSPAKTQRKKGGISYAKWGYIFIAPFFIVYITCTLLPQILTVYNSFFEYYMDGLKQVGPTFVGFSNYVKLFTPDSSGTIALLKYAGNTFILWILGAIPQIVVALMLAVFFTSYRLNVKGQGFFKTVIYMPNLIMASAFSMLFFTLFSNVGPVNQLLVSSGLADTTIDFFNHTFTVRALIALMNFLMWFGNTTILLMAGIMGIDQSLFESATIDGATSGQVFRKITLPLLMPILVYVVITAMIGGIQMFDVPQVLTNRLGTPNRTSMTLIMYLNSYLTPSKNYGMSGAISVMIFIITAILSGIVYKSLVPSDEAKPKPKPHNPARKVHHRKDVKAHEEAPAALPRSAIVSEFPTKTGAVLRVYPPIQKKEGTL
jgi:multiple sugar transport system permease protein